MCDLCNIFMLLLRAGLWNQIPPIENFPVDEKTWDLIYRMACIHTVEGVVYDGLIRLPIDCLPPTALLIKWTARVDFLEKRNKNMNLAIEELNEFFIANGLNPFLMKGQGVAACYTTPLHRVCGDIDWYFNHTDFIEANKLIIARGIHVKQEAGFSVSYRWKGIEVEHHSRLLDLHNPFLQDYLKGLQADELAKSGFICLNRRNVQLPSPLLMHVLVNVHILKHMLAFGIGLRQLCDSARVYYAYRNIDEKHLEEVYRKAGIYSWIQALNGVLITYLGLPTETLNSLSSTGLITQRMFEDVLQVGNFGFYIHWNKMENLSQVKREKAWLQIAKRFKLYAPYALQEACWFPIVQLYSHLVKRTAK